MPASYRTLILAAALFALPGCSAFDWLRPEPEIRYIPIPSSYLQECTLPPAPVSTGELSEAFVIAYQCAEQGNKDKRRIREMTAPTED